MSNYIDTIDYNGNPVICTRNQWFSHITAGHEIMKKNKAAVMDTIQSPDTVYESGENSLRQVFFKATSLATYSDKFMTKVIVGYDNPSVGEVVTAFPVKDEKGGIGDVVYSKPDKL